MLTYNRAFNLVQRMELITPTDGPMELICEYMGSSEFEWGAIPAARKRLAECDTLVTVRRPITLENEIKDVFFLGDATRIEANIESMQLWVNDGLRGKEDSGFDRHFKGRSWNDEPLSEWDRTRVWWALNVDLIWALEEEWIRLFASQRELRPTPFAGF